MILVSNYISYLTFFIIYYFVSFSVWCSWCCYVCFSLAVNHLCIVDISFKLSSLFSCDIRKINCALLSRLAKLGTSVFIILNRPFLFLYALHCVRKWISFSIFDGQNGQNRSSLGTYGRLCLPFSIIRQ